MNSALNLPFDIFYGGATTMWDLDHSWANEDLVKWLFTSFFERGGQFFQGNVTDVEELIKAQENPSAYPNLIVRVGGYSARFVNLNRALQDEIINRTRHKG
jgi:pyruvate-formate lyase